jgi:hypothetical protein
VTDNLHHITLKVNLVDGLINYDQAIALANDPELTLIIQSLYEEKITNDFIESMFIEAGIPKTRDNRALNITSFTRFLEWYKLVKLNEHVRVERDFYNQVMVSWRYIDCADDSIVEIFIRFVKTGVLEISKTASGDKLSKSWNYVSTSSSVHRAIVLEEQELDLLPKGWIDDEIPHLITPHLAMAVTISGPVVNLGFPYLDLEEDL